VKITPPPDAGQIGQRERFYWEFVSSGTILAVRLLRSPTQMSHETEAPSKTLDPAATVETSDNARNGAQKRRDPSEPAAVVGLGASAGGAPLAQRVSPLSWIRADSPPVRAVHGTADALVPFAQARALHRALDTAGVRNDLVTIDGGAHGDFSVAQWAHVARRIMAFLPAP